MRRQKNFKRPYFEAVDLRRYLKASHVFSVCIQTTSIFFYQTRCYISVICFAKDSRL